MLVLELGSYGKSNPFDIFMILAFLEGWDQEWGQVACNFHELRWHTLYTKMYI